MSDSSVRNLQLSGSLRLGLVELPWSGDGKGDLTIHLGDSGSPEQAAVAILEMVQTIQAALPAAKPQNLRQDAQDRARALSAPPVAIQAPVSEPSIVTVTPADMTTTVAETPPSVVARKKPGPKPGTKRSALAAAAADTATPKKRGRKPASEKAEQASA